MPIRATEPRPAPRLPESATSFVSNLLALIVGLCVIWVLAQQSDAQVSRWLAYPPLLPCVAVFVIIVAAEWFLRVSRRRALPALSATALRPIDFGRVALRLLGFTATLALIALAYWLFPEYGGSFYRPYWHFLRSLAPLALLVPFYFIWADSRVSEPRDEFVQFGQLVCGRWQDVDPSVIKRHLLGWTVKAFFLPLMSVYLSEELSFLYVAVRSYGIMCVLRFDAWFHLSYMIDLLFCVIGYTATTRLLDSHMRSVEPTMLGWAAALICYQPFYSVISRSYLQYEGNRFWDSWLQPWPLLQSAWGGAIILLSLIYALCTVAFGLRFSNLTHRGIITGGPYVLTKHPAYLAKNLSWWLISVPFVVTTDMLASLRHCALLLLLNGVYFLRARTEERHLSIDPVYVEYAQWINEHGMLRGLGRIMPWLRYRAPIPAMSSAASKPR
jgi:Isoprenylcysteine carboxyl methyltransferase (ICMT) family